MALNCEWAREALISILKSGKKISKEDAQVIADFIDDVETILKNNSIKQTPALLKPMKAIKG